MRKLAHWTRSSNCCKSWSPYGLCWRHASIHQEIIWIILLHYFLSPLCIFSLVFMCSWWSFFEEILRLPVSLLALLTFFERWAGCMAVMWGYRVSLHCPPCALPPLSLPSEADGADSHGDSWCSWGLFPGASAVLWKVPMIFLENRTHS